MSKITKISEVKRIVECPCRNGKLELITFFVSPNNGKVSLSYDYCTNNICPHRKGLLIFTDIIIPELSLGEI